jgi:hypothetical protein
MIPHIKAKVIFIGKKQKQIIFLKKQIKNGRLKKTHFPAPPILNIFSRKFHGLVLWLIGLLDKTGIVWLNLLTIVN